MDKMSQCRMMSGLYHISNKYDLGLKCPAESVMSAEDAISNDEKVTAQTGVLSKHGRYTKFCFNGKTVMFLHGKDLERYLSVKEWDNGYMVVECLGKQKGEYEDYIDLSYIMENLYMTQDDLKTIKRVVIEDAN